MKIQHIAMGSQNFLFCQKEKNLIEKEETEISQQQKWNEYWKYKRREVY